MVRDSVANVVFRLKECGFEPRRVGDDSWESRCPVHRGTDYALAVTLDAGNHVALACRSTQNCSFFRIVGALGLSNDQVYAETPDWLVNRVRRMERYSAPLINSAAPVAAVQVDADATVIGTERRSDSPEPLMDTRREAAHEANIPAECPPPADVCTAAAGSSECPTTETATGEPPLVNSLDLHVSGASLIEEAGATIEHLSSVQVLSQLASGAQLFRSADGRFCAQVTVGDRLEIYGLKSAGFRDWLITGYLKEQPEPPSSWAIRRVVGMLEARARFNTGIPEVFVRVGQDGGDDAPYFLDLGDPSGRAVAIRDQGWSVVDRPDVYFRRPEGLLPLPLPAVDGSIDLLRPYVNLTEADFRLMIAWLTAALRPVGPYPILVLNGEQASGKSTLAKILRMLIDPQACPVLALPKSTRDLMATAVNGWLLVYENISSIANWLSDCVCQLAFGGGFASRALFTNDERSVIYAQRPVILVGINDFVLRSDLRDRSVFMHLAAIAHISRRTERSFWPAFRADYPRILGGVLDAIVGGLRTLPSVELPELPRMADYAEWGEAASRGLGWGTETFLALYNANRKEASSVLLEDSPVADVVLALARTGLNWTGTTVNFYLALTKIARPTAQVRWPKSSSLFGAELRRIAPQLRLHGVFVSFERTRDARKVTVKSEGTPAVRS